VNGDHAIQELLATTLALESAICSDHFEQAPALIVKRESLLDSIEAHRFQESWRPTLELVKQIDDRLSGKLIELRALASSELQRQTTATKQLTNYKTAHATDSSMDRTG
jgi:hypothetical protein